MRLLQVRQPVGGTAEFSLPILMIVRGMAWNSSFHFGKARHCPSRAGLVIWAEEEPNYRLHLPANKGTPLSIHLLNKQASRYCALSCHRRANSQQSESHREVGGVRGSESSGEGTPGLGGRSANSKERQFEGRCFSPLLTSQASLAAVTWGQGQLTLRCLASPCQDHSPALTSLTTSFLL